MRQDYTNGQMKQINGYCKQYFQTNQPHIESGERPQTPTMALLRLFCGHSPKIIQKREKAKE